MSIQIDQIGADEAVRLAYEIIRLLEGRKVEDLRKMADENSVANKILVGLERAVAMPLAKFDQQAFQHCIDYISDWVLGLIAKEELTDEVINSASKVLRLWGADIKRAQVGVVVDVDAYETSDETVARRDKYRNKKPEARSSTSNRLSSNRPLTTTSTATRPWSPRTATALAPAREHGRKRTDVGLESIGLNPSADVYWNLNTPELYEIISRRNEGNISADGALIVDTGEHTGRAAKDKAIVREPTSEEKVFWGEVNKDYPQEKFDAIRERMMKHASVLDLFVQDTYAGADANYRLPVRIITELAWHSLFARTMFINDDEGREKHTPEFTVINIPSFKADPARDGTRSQTFILMDFSQRLVLIGGTSYAGETKKSVFTILNYLLPQRGVMSMHCSANVAKDDASNVAIFFGLSGTGKTTLSADPERLLIGDDEHGWSDDGVFNFEGGCYAKVIKLSAEAEPDIYRTTRLFGTILENVTYDPVTRVPDLDDASKTENTRAAYPLTSIPNIVPEGHAGHPSNIIMLTADAFGVLPPVAKLTPEQAMYHFLSGYTAKVAGTERGVTEPQATFSTCFGAPFTVLHPGVYAGLLGRKIQEHKADCWLVNTGWSGGPYGEGSRMKIAYTRAMIRAILNGSLARVETRSDPIFGVHVPVSCPNVPSEVLQPRGTWKDPARYDETARVLARRFNENFRKYEVGVSPEVRAAAPINE